MTAAVAPTADGWQVPEVDPDDILLQVRALKKHFPIHGGLLRRVVGQIKAVDGIDFYIKKGETLGLVGESGCGKSTAGRTIARLLEPTAGSAYVQGKNIFSLSPSEVHKLR